MKIYNKLTDEQKNEAVELYQSGKNYTFIGKKFGVTGGSIASIFKKRGIKSRGCVRFKVDDSIFESVSSKEVAYFLGFLYADGYIHEKTYQVELGLQSKDRDILEKLNKLVNYEKQLTYKKSKKHWKTGNMESDSYRLLIKNKKIANDLIKLGLRQNKSFTLQWPSFINNEFIWPFIRGYFDGDGSICIKKNGRGTLYGSCSIISSVDFINGLREFLLSLGFSCNIDKSKMYSKPMVTLVINKINHIYRFYENLYDDTDFFLTRKKEKFEELFRIKNSLLCKGDKSNAHEQK